MVMTPKDQTGRGAVRFALIHHGACAVAGRCHHRIAASGQVVAELAETERGPHAQSVAIALAGDFDVEAPGAAQLEGLERLLLELTLRYPALAVGAHRQVRGEAPTTCPGRLFPMRALIEWSRTELPRQRDLALAREVERQYSKC